MGEQKGQAKRWSSLTRMTQVLLAALVLLIAVVCCVNDPSFAWAAQDTFAADYADTSRGGEDAPYRVTTEQDLYDFAKVVNGKEPQEGAWVATGNTADSLAGKYVSLEVDITLTKAATPVGIGEYNGSSYFQVTPISFKGVFKGNNHTIRNWFCDENSNPASGNGVTTNHYATSFSSLFGSIEGASIQDLIVEVTFAPKSEYSGKSYCGGLVALVNAGTNRITHCGVEGPCVTSATTAGGLVACYNQGSLEITNSYHIGKVSAQSGAGGFVGNPISTALSITRCYQSGEVSVTTTTNPQSFCGVFTGSGTSKVTFDACVTDQDAALVGANNKYSDTSSCVRGVTNWTADNVIAALGGAGDDAIFDFSAAATKNGTEPPPFRIGVVSKTAHSITFFKGSDDVTGTLPTLASQIEGTTITMPEPKASEFYASELKRRGYTFAGWVRTDSDADTTLYKPGDVFTMPDEAVEFTAQWTVKEATVISTEDELRDLASGVNAGTVATEGEVWKLGADIQLTKVFTPIGSSAHNFKGVFYGDGHVVRGLSVSDETASSNNSGTDRTAGLFGYVSNAIIDGIGVEGSIDTQNVDYVGGLVGHATGSVPDLTRISHCYSRVTVKGKKWVGSLVGQEVFTVISNCYATGSATLIGDDAESGAGGLIGGLTRGSSNALPDVLVSNCYASGSVLTTGASAIKGALIGRVFSNPSYDSTLTGNAMWPALSHCYVLASNTPAYMFYNSGAGSTQSVDESVSEQVRLSATALSETGASVLGDAFKRDSSVSLLQINAGYPLLSWEIVPSASKIQLFVTPPDAKVSLIDETNEQPVLPDPPTDVDPEGYYAFTTNSLHTYKATVQETGYNTQTVTFPASAEPQQKTVELQKTVFKIIYNDVVLPGRSWAESAAPPQEFTYFDEDIKLPGAEALDSDDYAFVGWFDNDQMQGVPLAVIPAGTLKDISLYAGWRHKEALAREEACYKATTTQKLAEDVQSNVVVSADGADVAPDAQWVTQKDADALEDAVQAVKAACENDEATADQIQKAIAALEEAIDEYKAALQPGKKGAQPEAQSGTQPSEGQITTAPSDALSAIAVNATYNVGNQSYQVVKIATNSAAGEVAFTKAKNAKKVTIPATVKLVDGRTYNVTSIAPKAFKNMKKLTQVTVGKNVKKISKSAFFKTPKLKKIVIKSSLLKKASVKQALKGSKVKARSLVIKAPKKVKKAYKKIFTKANLKAPKSVVVK